MGYEYLKLCVTDADQRNWLNCLSRCLAKLQAGAPIFLCTEAQVFGMRLVMEAALTEKLGPWDMEDQPWGHPKLNPLGGYGELPGSDAPDNEAPQFVVMGAAIEARLDFVTDLLDDLKFEDSRSAQDDCTQNHECPDCLLEEDFNAPQAP